MQCHSGIVPYGDLFFDDLQRDPCITTTVGLRRVVDLLDEEIGIVGHEVGHAPRDGIVPAGDDPRAHPGWSCRGREGRGCHTAASYHCDGDVRCRCVSLARIAAPVSERDGATAQALLPPGASGRAHERPILLRGVQIARARCSAGEFLPVRRGLSVSSLHRTSAGSPAQDQHRVFLPVRHRSRRSTTRGSTPTR